MGCVDDLLIFFVEENFSKKRKIGTFSAADGGQGGFRITLPDTAMQWTGFIKIMWLGYKIGW